MLNEHHPYLAMERLVERLLDVDQFFWFTMPSVMSLHEWVEHSRAVIRTDALEERINRHRAMSCFE